MKSSFCHEAFNGDAQVLGCARGREDRNMTAVVLEGGSSAGAAEPTQRQRHDQVVVEKTRMRFDKKRPKIKNKRNRTQLILNFSNMSSSKDRPVHVREEKAEGETGIASYPIPVPDPVPMLHG